MANWVLTTLVALLVSCLPTDWDSNHSASQNRPQSQSRQEMFAPRPLTDRETNRQIHYGEDSSLEQCQAQPNIMWCKGYDEFHQPLTEETIKTADSRVRDDFTYSSDIIDTWRVHSHEVMNTRAWAGDCDDLATTALDMLARQGQPLDRMWLVLVAAKQSSKVSGRLDHLIAIVEDDQGRFWIVGDTSEVTVELKFMKYRPLAYMSTNDRVWHGAEVNDNFATRFNVPVWSLGQGQLQFSPTPRTALPNEVPVPVENS